MKCKVRTLVEVHVRARMNFFVHAWTYTLCVVILQARIQASPFIDFRAVQKERHGFKCLSSCPRCECAPGRWWKQERTLHCLRQKICITNQQLKIPKVTASHTLAAVLVSITETWLKYSGYPSTRIYGHSKNSSLSLDHTSTDFRTSHSIPSHMVSSFYRARSKQDKQCSVGTREFQSIYWPVFHSLLYLTQLQYSNQMWRHVRKLASWSPHAHCN